MADLNARYGSKANPLTDENDLPCDLDEGDVGLAWWVRYQNGSLFRCTWVGEQFSKTYEPEVAPAE